MITKLYPVRPTPGVSKTKMFLELEACLDQWLIHLPEELRYETRSRRQIPPPHILFLHIRYWGAVLLLNRALYVVNAHTHPTHYLPILIFQDPKLERVKSSTRRHYQSHIHTRTELTTRTCTTLELKAFDLAQGAASHISAIGTWLAPLILSYQLSRIIVTTYREHFTLKRSSPFLTSFILAAG